MSAKIARWTMNWLYPRACRVLRQVWPVLRIGRYVLVTRFDDVQEVLSRPEEFVVPYERKIASIGWLPINFLAKERRDENYRQTLATLRTLWSDDDLDRVSTIGERVTTDAMAAGGGRLDAVRDVMLPSALAVVEEYYGVAVEDTDEFTQATYAVAGYIFGVPEPSAGAVAAARTQIETVWRAIDAAMALDQRERDTVIGRWQREHAEAVSAEVFRCILTHMIMGFIPAHTNGGGRALEVLLSDRLARERAIEVARDDEADINQVVYEALRFLYILPVVWRTNGSMVVLRRETKRPVRIRAGSHIMLSTWSAMQDRRRVLSPYEFKTGRSPHVYMTFGQDFHYCVGRAISDRLMAANMRGLLAKRARRDAGRRTRWAGMVPSAIPVRHD